MKTILFYGDSLVYGKIPKYAKRYERGVNFIGVLEGNLGLNYRIIDEGLRARTIAGENHYFKYRDGLNQFGPILGSHLPLDVVCIFLGTNDCNMKDTKNNEEIYSSLLDYKNQIIDWSKNLSIEKLPKIIIIAPPVIRSDQVINDEAMSCIFDSNSEIKSNNLKTVYKEFCEKENCIFFDAGKYCITANDEGIHLDPENNLLLGNALSEQIKSII